jgi:agmatine deiminase
MSTPIIPAEWAPHRAMWLGFPSHAELWQENLEPAQDEVADLARALAGPGEERVRLMVCGDEAEAAARKRLDGVSGVEIVRALFGDIWLRDTGPIFREDGKAIGFRFNGWGGKYEMEGDDQVAAQIAAASGAPLLANDFVLEGGAVDRNPGWDEAAAEAALGEALGARKVLWLGEGLRNDHTDGHVDNLARVVAPGVVASPVAWGRADPNAELYDETARQLGAMTGVRGAPLQVMRIPSPGWMDGDGGPAPASHMNFIIANGAVIVPLYEDEKAGAFAVDAVKSLFPERKAIGLSSKAILTGGGSFHCITQQEPA